MFVSVVIDPGGKETAEHLAEVLTANGFERVQRACWESVTMSESGLVTLKQDIDRLLRCGPPVSISYAGCDGNYNLV